MISFIVNPAAKSWKGRKEWEHIESMLQKSGTPYDVHLTEAPGHAGELAAALSDPESPEELIGVFGGDGTLNEVISGLNLSSEPTLAYFPCGSGNDFARGMELAYSEDGFAALLSDPDKMDTVSVDVCSVSWDNEQPRRFVVSSGIGFDAQTCYDTTHSPVKAFLNRFKLGKLAYLAVGIRDIFTCPLTSGVISINGGSKTVLLKNIAFISAHNLPYEGGGFFFGPKAVFGDGLLDLCIVTAPNHFVFLLQLVGSLFGKHIYMRGVHYIRCRQADITLSAPLHLHMDGETPGPVKHVRFNAEAGHFLLKKPFTE